MSKFQRRPPPAPIRTSFVARELDRISARLCERDLPAGEYERLYATQHALSWALEPTGFASPYEFITDTAAGSKGYRIMPSATVLRYLRPLCVATITHTDLPPPAVQKRHL